VNTRNSDDWTIDRWRLERRFNAFEIDDPPGIEQVPTLWKDLTLVSAIAVVFWLTAAVLIAVIISAQVTRETFGYSFATWRFHLRGETIRSAADVGWLRELTVRRQAGADAGSERIVVSAVGSADAELRFDLDDQVLGVPMRGIAGSFVGARDLPAGTTVTRVVVHARDPFGFEELQEVRE